MIRRSLQFRLSLWLALIILLVATLAGGFSYLTALEEANELQDDILEQISVLFDKYNFPIPPQFSLNSPRIAEEIPHIFVQQLPLNRAVATDKPTKRAFLQDLVEGVQNTEIGPITYRVFVKTLASGKRLAVLQEASLRDEIAQNSALRTIIPFVVLIPLLILFVAKLILQMFKPVTRLVADIKKRSDGEMHEISNQNLPEEIQPFILEINRLLGRTARSISQQKRFIADAAHELRSPLTALSLQAELLSKADLSAFAQMRLSQLQTGIKRNRLVVEQLLTLARSQSSAAEEKKQTSLRQVIKMVLEELVTLAISKNIDIGLVTDNDVCLLTTKLNLYSLVRNLVDNAIKYTPEKGRIDLFIHQLPGEHSQFVIQDNGPGIPSEDQTRVFEPFYRVPGQKASGAGLGLSIVRTLAEHLGATVDLDLADHDRGRGLKVTVAFPRPSRL